MSKQVLKTIMSILHNTNLCIENKKKLIILKLDNYLDSLYQQNIEQIYRHMVCVALVALIDEIMIAQDSTQLWQKDPLQLHYFSHYKLGEEFYTQLDKLCEKHANPYGVLLLYKTCLDMGFRGKLKNNKKELNLYYYKIAQIIKPSKLELIKHSFFKYYKIIILSSIILYAFVLYFTELYIIWS